MHGLVRQGFEGVEDVAEIDLDKIIYDDLLEGGLLGDGEVYGACWKPLEKPLRLPLNDPVSIIFQTLLPVSALSCSHYSSARNALKRAAKPNR